jgi:hypothetical protein
MIIMLYFAFEKHRGLDSRLLKVFVRDGISYFVLISGMPLPYVHFSPPCSQTPPIAQAMDILVVAFNTILPTVSPVPRAAYTRALVTLNYSDVGRCGCPLPCKSMYTPSSPHACYCTFVPVLARTKTSEQPSSQPSNSRPVLCPVNLSQRLRSTMCSL